MITRIVIENFKSLRKVDLALGRVNLFIGTNASGKSNFLDALRVLQGIGNGFTISEILDGKPRSATNEVWQALRGGKSKTLYTGSDSREVRITVEGSFPSGNFMGRPKERGPRRRRMQACPWQLLIAFLPEEGKVTHENLFVGKNELYNSDAVTHEQSDLLLEVRYYTGKRGRQPHLKFENSRPTLTQFASGGAKWPKDTDAGLAYEVSEALANMQGVDPFPATLRDYSQALSIQRMGERGENFAALVKTICENKSTKDAYLSWLRQLRPEEIDDVGTLSGAVGEPMFMLQEGGHTFPAPVLSDGTLRFAALAAAFFQPDMPRIMTIEEVENGIHASRLQLLLELLRSQAAASHTQVIATTHSATVLDWLQKDEYKTTFFCQRDEATSESCIRSLADVPHFLDAVKKTPVSELFTEGWLETTA